MSPYSTFPLDAAVAAAKQKFGQLTSIRTFEALEAGETGDAIQSKQIDLLLGDLSQLIIRIRSELANQVRSEKAWISLAPTHSEFLRSVLLPSATRLLRIYYRGSPLAELFVDETDHDPEATRSVIRDAMWFSAEYVQTLMDPHDDRQLEADVVFETLDQAWFQPDSWSANLRSLRPVLLGIELSKVPARIQVRLTEMHRAS